MPDLHSKNPKERNEAVNRILKIAQSNLVLKNDKNNRNLDRITKDPTKQIPTRTKKSRIKKKYFFTKQFLN